MAQQRFEIYGRSSGVSRDYAGKLLNDDDFRCLAQVFKTFVQGFAGEDASVAIDAQDETDARRRAMSRQPSGPAMKIGGCRVGQRAGPGAGGNQHGHRLRVAGRVTGARVEQVGIAPTIDFEEALVVAGGADRFAVVERDGGQGPGLARMLDADPPFLALLAAQAITLPPMLISALRMPMVAQDAGGPVEATPFR